MDATQKAAQMVHLTLVSKKDDWFNESNVGFALVYEYIFDSAAEAAQRINEIQELAESAPLGIPVIFTMDTEAGAAIVKDATFLPDEINQGAEGDPELVAQLNEVLRTELMAVGVRMALSPDADLITDPRWGRNQECYSEDTDVVQTLIVAAVQALQGVTDPEQKRKIIGTEFFNVFWDEIRPQDELGYFAQGTIYPDCIESGKGDADTIKTHHNKVKMPEDAQFLGLVEPLCYLF